MTVVPAGQFKMGSPPTEPGRNSDEGPQTLVSIGRPFAVGRLEVTVGEYKAFIEASGYKAGRNCEVWNGRGWQKRAAATFLGMGLRPGW